MPEFQERLDALNAEDPPTLWPPPVIGNMRHPCTSRANGQRRPNLALALHEVYWTEGEHAFIFREGKCSRCGTLARSRTGRVVLAAERPPLHGRQAR